jgi:hypothetical protein
MAVKLEVEFSEENQHAAGDDGTLSCSVNACWRTYRGGNRTEAAATHIAIRNIEIGMVEQIVSVSSDIKVCALGDVHLLVQPRCDGKETRSTKAVRIGVAKVPLPVCIGGAYYRRKLTCRQASSKDGCFAAASPDCVRVQRVRQDAAGAKRCVAKAGGDLTVGHRERSSTVEIKFATEPPATQCCFQQATT